MTKKCKSYDKCVSDKKIAKNVKEILNLMI